MYFYREKRLVEIVRLICIISGKMNKVSRSEFLGLIAGNTNVKSGAPDEIRAVRLTDSGIKAYKGVWGKEQILHLIRRSLFGATHSDYEYFSKLTLNESLDILLTPSIASDPPVNNYNDSSFTDPEVPFGKTWVRCPLNTKGITNDKRLQSLKGWWIGLMLRQDRSLTEKMILFWHNHVAAEFSPMSGARTSYTYVAPLRQYALGNFKKLIMDITTTPGMLQYLSGDHNTATAPNENYSRELQELFTVGKGPGSHYTQGDVQAAARILTGWVVDRSQINTLFMPDWHDTRDKKFSSFYNNTIIKGRAGEHGALTELREMIDMIFAVKETARHTCRCLYRWFVHPSIDRNAETLIIEPLADILVENKYEVIPVLRALLGSEHFFDRSNMGSKIKNPMDHLIGLCRQFNLTFDSSEPLVQYRAGSILINQLGLMAMCPGDPPNVAGWPEYYLDPSYQQLWINSDTLVSRNIATDALLSRDGLSDSERSIALKFDVLGFTSGLTNPADVNLLIAESTALLSPVIFDATQVAFLKTILLAGGTDEHLWRGPWSFYAATPGHLQAKETVTNRLREYYTYLLHQAECQLM
jgi:uncharacterized protein (DUF1800 family)